MKIHWLEKCVSQVLFSFSPIQIKLANVQIPKKYIVFVDFIPSWTLEIYHVWITNMSNVESFRWFRRESERFAFVRTFIAWLTKKIKGKVILNETTCKTSFAKKKLSYHSSIEIKLCLAQLFHKIYIFWKHH